MLGACVVERQCSGGGGEELEWWRLGTGNE